MQYCEMVRSALRWFSKLLFEFRCNHCEKEIIIVKQYLIFHFDLREDCSVLYTDKNCWKKTLKKLVMNKLLIIDSPHYLPFVPYLFSNRFVNHHLHTNLSVWSKILKMRKKCIMQMRCNLTYFSNVPIQLQ